MVLKGTPKEASSKTGRKPNINNSKNCKTVQAEGCTAMPQRMAGRASKFGLAPGRAWPWSLQYGRAALLHGRAIFRLATLGSPELCRTSILLPIHLESLLFNVT